jgi:plasmid rolling circle replication initiator protein Rep
MSEKFSDGGISRIPRPSKKSSTKSPSLTDLSPRDKPWDVHRGESDQISLSYAGSEFQRYSERIDDCAQLLGFGLAPDAAAGAYRLKLRTARFCHVRTCMVCSWRRSLMYKARAYKALPRVIADYPTMRYLFVTLTLKNCSISELKQSIIHLNKSFSRLAKIKEFPAIGYIKTVEVTRGKRGDAHPHLHILMGVKASYFSTGYISKADWCAYWKRAAKVEYTPVMDVQAIKPNHSPVGILAEIIKYQTKPNDLIFSDREWFLEYTKQIKGTKAFALGGIMKEYFKELEKEETTDEMIGNDESQDGVDEGELFFGWRQSERKYRMVDPPS